MQEQGGKRFNYKPREDPNHRRTGLTRHGAHGLLEATHTAGCFAVKLAHAEIFLFHQLQRARGLLSL